MKNTLSFFLLIFLSQSVFPQDIQNKCGTDQLDAYNKANFREYASFRIKNELLLNNENQSNKTGSTIVIPVVIHVIYRKPEQNISDAQIFSQIEVLNKDYNKLNWDIIKVPAVWESLIADSHIEFILANRDPNGNVTNGITRKSTTIKDIASIGGNIYYQSTLGGQDIWDRNQYLNIWVCEISGGVYGFSSMPGAPKESDGLVISFGSFGTMGTAIAPTEKGRTATHEIGHWLDLFHPWGLSTCGDDFVSDTPIQETGNFGCKTYPYQSPPCNATTDGEMFMNFMDYSDDGCLNFFTLGQKDRMIGTLNNSRVSILNSGGYNGIYNIEKKGFKVYPSPANDFVKVEISSNLEINKIEILAISGVRVSEVKIIQPRSDQSIFVGQIKNGIYFLNLYTNQGVFTEKILVWHD